MAAERFSAFGNGPWKKIALLRMYSPFVFDSDRHAAVRFALDGQGGGSRGSVPLHVAQRFRRHFKDFAGKAIVDFNEIDEVQYPDMNSGNSFEFHRVSNE